MRKIEIELIDEDNNYGNRGHIIDSQYFEVSDNINVGEVVDKVISKTYIEDNDNSTEELFDLIEKEEGFNRIYIDIEIYQFDY